MRIFVNIFRNYLCNKLNNKKTIEVSYMAVEEQLEQAKKAVERQWGRENQDHCKDREQVRYRESGAYP